MTCLTDSDLQGYLEEFGPSPFRQMVEAQLAACARCRTAFERVMATHHRVNRWLAEMASPADNTAVDVNEALTRVLNHVGVFAKAGIWGKGTNPKAIALSVFFQSALIAILMLTGRSATEVRETISKVTIIAPPPPPIRQMQPQSNHGAGGGQRYALPPRRAPKAFIPTLPAAEHAAVVIDPSLIAPPDAWTGSPLGVTDDGPGLGISGGIGIGNSHGMGGDGIDAGAIYTIGNRTTRPSVLNMVDPEYSDEARKAKYSGALILSIVVNTDGRAGDIQVVRSLGMGLDEKAIEAIQKWRFKPGTNKGLPVRVRAQIEINFRLL